MTLTQEKDRDMFGSFDTDSLKSDTTASQKNSGHLQPPDTFLKKSKSVDRLNVMVNLCF